MGKKHEPSWFGRPPYSEQTELVTTVHISEDRIAVLEGVNIIPDTVPDSFVAEPDADLVIR